jgi:hypothetical protein
MPGVALENRKQMREKTKKADAAESPNVGILLRRLTRKRVCRRGGLPFI